MTNRTKELRAVLRGFAYISPNIIGFMAFTLIPLVVSLYLSFTNWDLRYHNMFKGQPLRFVGLDNYIYLLQSDEFWRYMRNTLFFKLTLPLNIGGSLFAAILLNQDIEGANKRVTKMIILSAVLALCLGLLVAFGMGASALTILFTGVFGLMLVGGASSGVKIYRTLFYLPHFTAGIATFILWKKLFNPQSGPLTQGLKPILSVLSDLVNSMPANSGTIAAVLVFITVALIYFWASRVLYREWVDGELGSVGFAVSLLFLSFPLFGGYLWFPLPALRIGSVIVFVLIVLWRVVLMTRVERFQEAPLAKGFGTNIMFSMVFMALIFILVGMSVTLFSLPERAAVPGGLPTPNWLSDYHWAKPSLMIMALWGAIGSNNMILYLAGLSNVSEELYEAADIDGASRFQKFWHVTWPQLAPITYFIVVMAVIHSLQGGFEMARVMTEGGPAGSTTTLAYYVYNEGFSTGRMAYSSAVSWTLFAIVFVLTMLNVRFGNRYVND